MQAIEGADAFVLLLSDAANESDYVFRELELASASRRRVVPVLVAGVDPSRRFRFFIASSQWLRAPTAGDEGWIDALASTLAAPEPEAPPAEADVESVEAPGADSRRPRFAQHPVRWLGAGAAVLLVLVVVTVAIRWGPDATLGRVVRGHDDHRYDSGPRRRRSAAQPRTVCGLRGGGARGAG